MLGWQAGLAASVVTIIIAVVLLLVLRAGLHQTLRQLGAQFDQARDSLRTLLTDLAREDTETAVGIFTRLLQPTGENLQQEEDSSCSVNTRLQAVQMSFGKLAGQLQGHVPPS